MNNQDPRIKTCEEPYIYIYIYISFKKKKRMVCTGTTQWCIFLLVNMAGANWLRVL